MWRHQLMMRKSKETFSSICGVTERWGQIPLPRLKPIRKKTVISDFTKKRSNLQLTEYPLPPSEYSSVCQVWMNKSSQQTSSTRGTLGFAVLRCCSVFCAVFWWIKSHIAVLRWSQTLRCAMFVLLNLRCSVKRNYLRCRDTSSIYTVYMQTMRYERYIWLCDVFAGLSPTANLVRLCRLLLWFFKLFCSFTEADMALR